MTIFAISILVVLVVSALCSVSEAALYAVRRPYVRQIAEQGSRSGKLLLGLKDNMEQPISAILIVNTIANTAGAAVAGAQARVLFGEMALGAVLLAGAGGVLALALAIGGGNLVQDRFLPDLLWSDTWLGGRTVVATLLFLENSDQSDVVT